METIGISRLRTLVRTAEEPSLTIYLPKQPNRRQAELSCRKLLKTAGDMLKEQYPDFDRNKFLDAVEESFDRFVDILPFDGIAVFKSENFEGFYRTHQENPELVSVGDHFNLKPLLGVFPKSRQFYLVRLADESVKLYLGNADQLVFIKEIHDLELSEETEENQTPIFELSDRKKRWMPLLRAAEREVWMRVAKQSTPVVVAGPHKLVSLYRAMNRHLFLGGFETEADASKESLHSLHASAWPIADHIFDTEIEQLIYEYEQLRHLGKATSDVAEIVSAAGEGKIKRLFVAREAEVWGHIDQDRSGLKLHGHRANQADVEVLDELAQIVLRQEGEVCVTSLSRMPGASPAAAILRSSIE